MNIFSKEMLMAGGEKVFVRPNLTSNGSSGDYFYVTASVNNSTAYKAFDDSDSSYWACSASGTGSKYIRFDCQNGLNVTELKITNRQNWGSNSVQKIMALATGMTTYDNISFSQTISGKINTVNLSNGNYYNVYVIYLAAYSDLLITDIAITATEKG